MYRPASPSLEGADITGRRKHMLPTRHLSLVACGTPYFAVAFNSNVEVEVSSFFDPLGGIRLSKLTTVAAAHP